MSTLLYFIAIALAIGSVFLQSSVRSTFAKYSKVLAIRGYTGADVARMILERNGVNNVSVVPVSGELTDHYDPSKREIRLSQSVFAGKSVAALGVAAHETGHALQHATGYAALTLRSQMFPAVNFCQKIASPLIVLGIFITGLFHSTLLLAVGAALFTAVVAFQLVTLPVEFNASQRALEELEKYSFVDAQEKEGAKKVLSVAAMTYVAAATASIVTLLRLLVMLSGGRKR